LNTHVTRVPHSADGLAPIGRSSYTNRMNAIHRDGKDR
jgi:hypothetical protein